MRFLAAILFGVWALLLSGGCGGDAAYNPRSAPSYYQGGSQSQRAYQNVVKDGGAFIQDRSGKVWHVAHAQKYGMVPSGFQYGLGPFAITPIMNPRMLSPGDPGYPSDYENFLVLGANLNGFARAYPIRGVMSRHEIANEQFGDAHVAVAF